MDGAVRKRGRRQQCCKVHPFPMLVAFPSTQTQLWHLGRESWWGFPKETGLMRESQPASLQGYAVSLGHRSWALLLSLPLVHPATGGKSLSVPQFSHLQNSNNSSVPPLAAGNYLVSLALTPAGRRPWIRTQFAALPGRRDAFVLFYSKLAEKLNHRTNATQHC